MACNPNKSLKDLSEDLGINYWTLYKTVERMRRVGIFREITIPNFRMLGYELFVVGYGNLTKKKVTEIQKVRDSGSLKGFSANIFYGLAESYRGFVMGTAKNYTDVKRTLVAAERVIRLREVMGSDVKIVLLPFELTKIPLLFDFSRLLCREIHVNCNCTHGMSDPRINRRLSSRERQILYELTKNPNISLSELSERVGVTIQTASKIKNRLYDEGWLLRRIIPDLSLLDYEVLVFAHWNMNPDAVSLVEDMNPEGIDISNIIFLAYDILEGIAVAPFKNLKESREIISFFEQFGAASSVLVGEPRILFLSLQESIKIRDHDYAPLLTDFISN